MYINESTVIKLIILKLELVNDYPGFYLDRHFDHKEKTFNIVIYIEGDIESGATFALDEVLKVDFLPNRALFFDTTVVCTITAVIILSTGVLEYGNSGIEYGQIGERNEIFIKSRQ